MSFLDIPINIEDDQGDLNQQNVSNILQAALLAGTALARRGGGSRSKTVKKAVESTKKKGVAKKIKGTTVPRKELPPVSKPDRFASIGSMGSLATLAPKASLQELTMKTKTKGATSRAIKSAINKAVGVAERVGKKVKSGVQAGATKAKIALGKAGRQGKAMLSNAFVEAKAASQGAASNTRRLFGRAKQLAKTGTTKATRELNFQTAVAKKAISELPSAASTYRAAKEKLGLDRPGTFQTQLQGTLANLQKGKQAKLVEKLKGQALQREKKVKASERAMQRKNLDKQLYTLNPKERASVTKAVEKLKKQPKVKDTRRMSK